MFNDKYQFAWAMMGFDPNDEELSQAYFAGDTDFENKRYDASSNNNYTDSTYNVDDVCEIFQIGWKQGLDTEPGCETFMSDPERFVYEK